MSKYTPVFENAFATNFIRYSAMRRQTQRRVDRIIADPYHNTEALTDLRRGTNLLGCRSARVDRNFRIIFVICEECRPILDCEYCFCEEHTDQTIVFLTVGPHDSAYAME